MFERDEILDKVAPRIKIIYELLNMNFKDPLTKLEIIKKCGFQAQVTYYDILHNLEEQHILVENKVVMGISFYKIDKKNLIALIKKSTLYKQHLNIFLWK